MLTADHAWAHRVIEELRRKTGDISRTRALGYCVSVGHARFMAERFTALGLPAIALSSCKPLRRSPNALRDLAAGNVRAIFTVDLFNEGIDIPNVDTLLLLRPTESPTLFLQQLGRGLRRAAGKSECIVLDFVGTHRKEFRFDRRLRALLGGSRIDVERQVRNGFPFLPAGCSFDLDQVAQEIVLRSIREAIPSTWRERCHELRSLGDVNLADYLESTGLELEDVYAAGHSWTEMRREAGFQTQPAGPEERSMLRAVGRMLHVDDDERLEAYARLLGHERPPAPEALSRATSACSACSWRRSRPSLRRHRWRRRSRSSGRTRRYGQSSSRCSNCCEDAWRTSTTRSASTTSRSRSTPLHADGDPRGVRRGRWCKAIDLANRGVVGARLAVGSLRLHAR